MPSKRPADQKPDRERKAPRGSDEVERPCAADLFQELFGLEPRSQQLEFAERIFDTLLAAERQQKPPSLLAELPTGAGKTYCAFYAAYVARRFGYRQSVLVAGHQKTLQTQYATIAQTLSPDFGTAFVVFGIGNYACLHRVELELLRDAPFADLGPHAASTARFFGELLAEAEGFHGTEHASWRFSQERRWSEAAKGAGMSEAQAGAVWARVSAAQGKCACRQRALESGVSAAELTEHVCCPAVRSRLLGKRADVLIVNMSYVCTMAANGILQNIFDSGGGGGGAAGGAKRQEEDDGASDQRLVVYDEAHALPHAASALYEKVAFPPLPVERAEEAAAFLTSTRRRVPEPLRSVAAGLRTAASALRTLPKRQGPGERGEQFRIFERGYNDFTATRLANFRDSILSLQLDECGLAALRTVVADVEAIEARVEAALEPYRDPKELAAMGSVEGIVTRAEVEAALHIEMHAVAQRTPKGALSKAYRDAWRYLCEVLTTHFAREQEWDECQRHLYDTACEEVLRSKLSCVASAVAPRLRSVSALAQSLTLAREACSQRSWLRDPARAEQAPIVSCDGVVFELVQTRRARVLSEHLQFAARPTVMMSATLAGSDGVGSFESAIDFRFDTSMVLSSPFSPASRHFWCPATACVPFSPREADGAQWLKLQAALVARAVRANPKQMTLCISFSSAYNKKFQLAMEPLLTDHMHVPVEEEARLQYAKAHGQPCVVYGAVTLATGIDLPGRVGMVVLLRPLNLSPTACDDYERLDLGRRDESWKLYWWQSETAFRQAVGRLIRTETDRGVVLFFDKLDREGKPKRREHALVTQFFHASVASTAATLAAWPF